MWSVVILSPTLISTFPATLSVSALFTGNGLIFGPLTTSTSASSGAGAITMLSFITNCFGISITGGCPNSLGSVSTPVIALAAATSGLTK